MVVLEEGGMLTTGHNQYLQPDYLSPLPTTLDAKKSPLALLAQTCSQIGADTPSKPLVSSLEKSSKSGMSAANARSPPAAKMERTRGSPSEPKPLAFKPYEINVIAKKSSDDGRPASKASVHSASGNESVSASENNVDNKKLGGTRTPVGRKSASPASGSTSTSSSNGLSSSERKTPAQEREKVNESPRNSGASPIIRSGMEVLSGAGHPKESSLSVYKHASSLGGFSGNPLCCPPGLTENPAFRPPFAGASPFSHHHAAAAAALLGYPTATSATAGNPYLSYTRVKTPAGGETLVPVCKDPYCTGCQYSMHNAQMMMSGAPCPSGCTQCEHQKYGLAMALSSLGPMPPPSLSYPASLSGGRPYICNWIAGETYCGKRFNTSEELLQHLRSHTSLTGGDHASAALLGGPHSHPHPLLSPSAALHRAATSGSYPAPPLSPLSARYHPYGKPPTGPLPASLSASPYSAFNTLGPYYSPYAIYGQRIGAAVHP
ncbi:zinc finger protein Noc [Chelonus insularis]|uniref:zinc finger protein Noc n=1 Tax=Chelonus insularis TaxID=460826 RepID=UPI00158B22C2|nr:zinc finger protein Noc [Chelonus insularis]